MNIRAILSLLLVCASIGSARAGDPDGVAPQPGATTLTLQEAVRLALSRAPDVLLAEAQAIRTREAVRETRSLNRPQVFTGTGLAYNNGYPLSLEGSAPSIFQVSGSQAIFSKKNSSLIREAEQNGKATRHAVESAQNQISMKTALAYYQLHQARQRIEIASERLSLSRNQQQEVEMLLAAGRVRPVDAMVARNEVNYASQQLLVAQEQSRLSESELRELTGLRESINTADPQIENPIFEMDKDKLYQRALELTPEILQAEATLKGKELHVEAEKAERLPRAEIVGQYALLSKTNNYADYFATFTRNNYILGLSLQIPIFDGSRASSRIAQSRQEVSEAHYQLEGLKSDLKLSIERSLSALRIARGESDFARSDAEAAQELAKINQALLESGRISPKEMEDSRSMLQQKQFALLQANQNLFQRKLELLRAVGSIRSALQ